MFEPIPEMSKARILITNDDGIHAPGLKVLARIARALSRDVWIVAPASEQSAVAHSLTVRRPLRLHALGRRRYSVDGTPTDSVLLAIRHLLKDRRPHLLLSGVNAGGNTADDVTYSGTVAAAMEGTLLGIPSIALSQKYTDDHPLRWATAEQWAVPVIRKVCSVGWPRDVLINVNFPDVPPAQVSGIEIVRQGKRQFPDPFSHREDPHGNSYFWIGGTRVEDPGLPGTDLSAISRGAVAVTPLGVDFTSAAAMDRLVTAFQ